MKKNSDQMESDSSCLSTFTRKVIQIARSIPAGKVTTYGIIAMYADNNRAARQVARILHSSSSKYQLPWHRIVNRSGRISLPPGNGYERQRKLLTDEGVIFGRKDRIDLDSYLWWPGKNG